MARTVTLKSLMLSAVAAFSFGIGHAEADSATTGPVQLTGIVPYTQVDADYFELQDMYQRFHAKYPNITIHFDAMDHDAYHTKMQALAISGHLPNLLSLWPGKRTGYLTDRGYAMDLRPWITRDNLAATQRALFLAPQGRDGQIYELGVPYVLWTSIVYANKALLDKLGLTFPKTLKDFEAQAVVIRKAGYHPVVFGDQSSWILQSCLLSTLVGRMGGPDWFQHARFGTNGASFNDPPFVKALQIVQDMTTAGLIDKSEPSTMREQALSEFVSGKSVYFIGGIWEVENLYTSLTPAMRAEILMQPFPHIDGEAFTDDASTSGEIATGFGISKTSTPQQAEAAWKWIQFSMDPANADIYLKHDILPIYKNLDLSARIHDPLLHTSYDFSSGIHTVLPVLDDKMDAEGVEQIINAGLQEIVLGSTTPKQLAAQYETWVAAHDSNRHH